MLESDEGQRHTMVVAGLTAVLFLVLLAPFVRTLRLVRGLGPVDSTAMEGAATAVVTGTIESEILTGSRPGGASSPEAAEAAGSPLPTPGEAADWTAYHDPTYRFSLEIPMSWEQQTLDHPASRYEPDTDVLFEDAASGARLAVSVWQASSERPVDEWLEEVTSGLEPVDGRRPYNSLVAGRDALVTWSAETPTYPAQYAAFVPGPDHNYRVSYSAVDGGAAMPVFIRALVSLSLDGSEALDTIPPLPMPDGEYFPRPREGDSSG